MSLMFQRPVTFGEAAFYPFLINQSCRFDSADSAYLNDAVVPVHTNNQKCTLSVWIKIANIPIAGGGIFENRRSSIDFGIFRFNNDQQLVYYYWNDPTNFGKVWSPIMRDCTGWLHALLVIDTTNATAVDRQKLFLNGEQITDVTTDYGNHTQNMETYLIHSNGTDWAHRVGYYTQGVDYFDGYLAEMYVIDGQALTPVDFGQFKNGIWIPKRYKGTYGDAGFYLNFADENDLGNDVSGNNNDFTPINLDSTDHVLDSPTNNFITLSPLYSRRQANSYSDGNLVYQTAASAADRIISTSCIPTYGKWTFEGLVEDPSNAGIGIQSYQDGIRDSYVFNGDRAYVGGSTGYGASYTTNDIIKVCVDVDNETLDFYKNNAHQGQIDISSRNYEWGLDVYFMVGDHSSSTDARWRCDFGQLGFNDAPPTGYKALCSNNLIRLQNPAKSYDVYSDCGTENDYSSGTYTGNGNVNGPFVYLGYYPTDVCIDGDHYDETSSVIDVLSNGFKLRSLTKNTNTTSYTWEAWVYQDGKYSNAAPNVI